MQRRIWVLVLLVLAAAAYSQFFSEVQAVPIKRPLAEVPNAVGVWTGRADTMSERIVSVVGVEDYLLREYADGAGAPVSVYVGYYEKQQEGDQIHSPRHCLPGSGWQPTRYEEVEFATPGFNGGTTRANRYVVGKGDQLQLVFYWYQSQGRNITSDYAAKLWLVLGTILHRRTDGALIRLIAPMPRTGTMEDTQARLVAFGQEFLPLLDAHLPN